MPKSFCPDLNLGHPKTDMNNQSFEDKKTLEIRNGFEP